MRASTTRKHQRRSVGLLHSFFSSEALPLNRNLPPSLSDRRTSAQREAGRALKRHVRLAQITKEAGKALQLWDGCRHSDSYEYNHKYRSFSCPRATPLRPLCFFVLPYRYCIFSIVCVDPSPTPRVQGSRLVRTQTHGSAWFNVGALIVRMGFWAWGFLTRIIVYTPKPNSNYD